MEQISTLRFATLGRSPAVPDSAHEQSVRFYAAISDLCSGEYICIAQDEEDAKGALVLDGRFHVEELAEILAIYRSIFGQTARAGQQSHDHMHHEDSDGYPQIIALDT